ncbi:hypothetical protein [Pelosinus sp. sgz500959]|uniref:hypothetical protein n=1 Tax=Pelosinus sp. sgz500959 TaxID=3242472 RepID=UPI00366E8E81
MNFNRFLILAFLLFSIGIGILYNGLNRVPLRPIDPSTIHKHGNSSLFLNNVDNKQERSS